MADPTSNTGNPAGGDETDPPVDLGWLRECTDNDTDVMDTMLGMYFSRTSALLNDMDAAIAAGNAAEVRRLGHACVGSSSTCGMTKLAALFKELERKGVAGSVDGAAEIAAQARVEFARSKAYIDRTISR